QTVFTASIESILQIKAYDGAHIPTAVAQRAIRRCPDFGIREFLMLSPLENRLPSTASKRKLPAEVKTGNRITSAWPPSAPTAGAPGATSPSAEWRRKNERRINNNASRRE
ncbi:MAG: hypothetical protein WC429_21695, partial [Verrucomicrobiia bacterium]